MKRSKWLSIIPLILVLLATSGCEVQYSNPPTTFQDSDLVGTWELRCGGRCVDTLILRANGTFKQIYRDHTVDDYSYATPWNEWWTERFLDGRVRVHLQGARYYKEGIRIAERDGRDAPCPEDQPNCRGGLEPLPSFFHDPIARESLQMAGELVLNVQSDSSEQLVLLHMLLSSDHGFVSLLGKANGFSRVETP